MMGFTLDQVADNQGQTGATFIRKNLKTILRKQLPLEISMTPNVLELDKDMCKEMESVSV